MKLRIQLTSKGTRVASSPEGARIETPLCMHRIGHYASRPHPRARGLKLQERVQPPLAPVASSPEGARIETKQKRKDKNEHHVASSPEGARIETCSCSDMIFSFGVASSPEGARIETTTAARRASDERVASSPEGARIETAAKAVPAWATTSRPHPRARGLKRHRGAPQRRFACRVLTRGRAD